MNRERATFIYGSLTGFIVIAVIQLLTADNRSVPLTVALILFSMALPILIFLILSAQIHLNAEMTEVTTTYSAIVVVTILISFLGIVALFWHFHTLIGFIFLASTTLSMLMFIYYNSNEHKKFSVSPEFQPRPKPRYKPKKKNPVV
jgi:hypothetical protein